MSYILDALKKSEQERGHGSIPSVQTIHSSSLNYNNKKTYWHYFLIAAVLLNLIAILYFVFDKENKTPAEDVAMAKETLKGDVPDSLPAPAPALSTTPTEEHIQSNTVSITPGISSMQHGIDNEPVEANTAKLAQPHLPETIESKPGNINERPSISSNKPVLTGNENIVELYDLPVSIKQKLPSIVISAHVYSSNPLQRSIVINNNFLEEGEYVLDDLVLYEITRDGAIFSYHDTLFHHGVVSTWQ